MCHKSSHHRLRPWRLALAATAAWLLLAPAAGAATHTYTLRSQQFDVNGFETVLPKVSVQTPQRTGYITKFDAHLVYGDGRRVSIRRVMLHHIVFINTGFRGGPPKRTTCPGRKGQSFWGTGEERERLILPEGYGYPVDRRDRWRMQTMLMSHSLKPQRLAVQYTLTMVTGRRLQPVRPLWLRANGCTRHPSYDIPGGGAPGSTNVRSYDWTLPVSGRIVAAGAHLHGSTKGMTVSQQRCDGRTLIRHEPRFGNPSDLVYRIRPILHEPGPIATGYFLSSQGIPVRKGETLRVTGYYDDQYPHPQVMAITHVYVAVDDDVPADCAPLPDDAHYFWTRRDGRPSAPRIAIPFTALDDDGRLQTIERPDGATVTSPANATISVRDNGFSPANLVVDRGATVTWTWAGQLKHNVFYADGPRTIASASMVRPASYSRTLTEPGTYKLFCWLHPITMHQVITVR